jgi:hypothetical protein
MLRQEKSGNPDPLVGSSFRPDVKFLRLSVGLSVNMNFHLEKN